jgi:hypothetical protein
MITIVEYPRYFLIKILDKISRSSFVDISNKQKTSLPSESDKVGFNLLNDDISWFILSHH